MGTRLKDSTIAQVAAKLSLPDVKFSAVAYMGITLNELQGFTVSNPDNEEKIVNDILNKYRNRKNASVEVMESVF